MTLDSTRTLRGAVCGAIAAAVWALQQPLDKLVFRSRYDDVEILGRLVTRGNGSYPAGLALHMQFGAVFGAAYADLAPALPLPPAARGPAVAFVDHLVSWPLVRAVADRYASGTAGEEAPALAGNARAFAQATWRHLLFGLVLGELERHLNGVGEPAELEPEAQYSSNGHGSLEHAVSTGPTT